MISNTPTMANSMKERGWETSSEPNVPTRAMNIIIAARLILFSSFESGMSMVVIILIYYYVTINVLL